MAARSPKNPDIKEVMAKAGGLRLDSLVPKKGGNKRNVPAPEPDGNARSSTKLPSSNPRTRKGGNTSSVEVELRTIKHDLKISKARLEESDRQLKASKKTSLQAQSRADRAEAVLAELRKVLKAGKDAKPETFPGRVDAKVREALAETVAARTECEQAQEEAASLRLSLREVTAELERLRKEDEAILINPLQPASSIITDRAVDDSLSTEEEVAPSLFTEVASDRPLEELADAYREWTLGYGDHRKSRRGRLEAGVDPAWKRENLEGEVIRLSGDFGLRLDIRNSDDVWRLRFQHKDSRTEGTSWVNLVRLMRLPNGGTQVKHAVIRNTGAGSQRPAPASVPRILRELLHNQPNPAPWLDFKGTANAVDGEGLHAFVEQVLLNPERTMPVVFLSRAARAGGTYSLDPDALARALDGLAVVYAQAFEDQRMLTCALLAAGATEEDAKSLSCFDGGARLYRTGFAANSDRHSHPLWTRAKLEIKPEPSRIRTITSSVVSQTVPQRVPQGFSRIIEDFDLEQSRLLDERMAIQGDLVRQLEAKTAHIQALEDALIQSRTEAAAIPALQKKNQDLDAQFTEALHEIERLEQDLEERRQEVGRLKIKIESQIDPTPIPAVQDHRDLLEGLLDEKWVPVSASLRILQALFPDRLEVLPNGYKTADTCTFQYPKKAKEMLTKLATRYYDDLLTAGDAQAAKVFGDDYSPFESDNLSKEGQRARTFTRNGKDYLMTAHLKQTHGHSKAANNVLRIHFYWVAEEKKILIGHVGAHLPL